MAKPPDLHKQTKEKIHYVYKYLKDLVESQPHATLREIFGKTQDAVAKLCGIHTRTLQRICAEADDIQYGSLPTDQPSFESPKKKRPHLKPITGIDDFNKDVVRRTVQEFYDRGEYPTVEGIRNSLVQKIQFSGSNTSIWRILKNLGFKYKKSNDGRNFLMERNDIVAARIKFLRKMHNIRNESSPRPIIYLDETWINQNHSKQYIWQDSTSRGGLKVPVGKGSRLIICHAGSAQHGFIEGAQLVFQSKSTGDYHQEMNSDVFRGWFLDLLKGLEEPSVIVMDNASYHSCFLEKIPSTKTRKADIVAWLQNKNIIHNPNNTKSELLYIVRQHKEKYKVYELDAIANEMGHEVVRLPPFHCHYNPIELIWAQIKNEVAAHNKSFKIADVRKLLLEAIAKVTVEDWKKCVKHSETLQEEDFHKEVIREDIIEPIIINLQDDSDCSSDSENEDELF